ncbi:MAG: nicotinamide riboside transporter PnuC, partial [Bacteroidota bacterium]
SLIYLFLLVRENIWCWLFSILSALFFIYSFINVKLYSEAVLYSFYILFSIYGWYKWAANQSGEKLTIKTLAVKKHVFWVIMGFLLAFGLGYVFKTYTDAQKSFIDSNTTIFSFIASYLEAHKYLYAWVYWIIINGVTAWLYFSQGLAVYAGLMVIYFVMSIIGLRSWREKYLATN